LLGVAADAGEVAANIEGLRSYFDPTLCVVGSDTILGEGVGEAQAWAESFELGRAVKVRVDAIGSGNGLRLAAEGGCAHVLAMSDPMSAEDEADLAAAGVEVTCAAEIGYDVIVFITDINNPVRTIEDRDLARILRGSIGNWGEVSTAYPETITIYYRPGSGTTNVVLENLVNFSPAEGQPFPVEGNYVACDSNEDCLDKTLTTPGSLYWVSAAWMETQPEEYLKVLGIAVNEQITTDPRQEGFSLGRYPSSLVRPLYMYVLDGGGTNAEQLGLAREFLELVRGVEGQQILERAHFYTHFNRPGRIEVPLPGGFAAFDDPNRQVCRGG
jgi:ABC-type phosphate transport system substrate-binding protein